MNTNQNEEIRNRMTDLATESTQTFIDAAYLAERQSAQLLEAWMNTLDASQKQQREIAAKLVRQAREAQQLLQQYVQESFRAGVDAFTQTTQTGTQQASRSAAAASDTVKETRSTTK
jgi:hypothetical protein